MNRLFFTLQVGVVAALLLLLYHRAAIGAMRTAALILAFWLIGLYALAASGAFAFGPLPPPLMVVVSLAFILTTWLGLSPIGTALATRTPLAWLVGFQTFRVPVEIFLWQAHRENLIPIQMTWEGRNLDVLTGLSAPVVALLASRPRLVRAWNIMGLGLLANIVGVAIASMPTPLRLFHNEPANSFVATAPYVWLPTFLVQAAWLGHLLVLRRLRNSLPVPGAAAVP